MKNIEVSKNFNKLLRLINYLGENYKIPIIVSTHPRTRKQLKKWDLKYHELIFGKPSYDLFIDDKSIFFNKNWVKKIK